MSGEEIRAREEFGALGGCFVEGDPEQQRRERRVKRRALALSVSLQIVALSAVILLPLLSKAERISLPSSYVPMPPYQPIGDHVVRTSRGPAPPRPIRDFSIHYPPPNAPARPATSGGQEPTEPGPGFLQPGPGGPPCAGSCIDIGIRTSAPTPPVTPPPPKRIVITRLEPAMLIYRVEPVYPALAKQIRREGRVELHAIISTTGTIQSLQVASGDVFFVQSAMDAVRQWRYRATVLNGQPVEVETNISVIYTLAH